MKKSILTVLCVALIGILAAVVYFGVNTYLNDDKEVIEEEKPIEQPVINEQVKIIPKVLNFNDYYDVVYDESATLQEKVDAGYLVGAYGDYYHHNTEDFLELFWMLNLVEEIQIDGKAYSFVEYTNAALQTSDNSIKMDDGTIVEYNDRTEIITCQAEEDNPLRYVAILKEK